MLTLAVFVALGKTKIDDVDIVFSALITSDQEVVRLDVSMDDPLLVHFLNSMDLPTPTVTTHSRGELLRSQKKKIVVWLLDFGMSATCHVAVKLSHQ